MDPTAATSEILKLGLPGAIIIVLIAACAALWRAYSNANEARIKEGDDHMSRYVAVLEKVMAAMNDTNTALQVIKDRLRGGRE